MITISAIEKAVEGGYKLDIQVLKGEWGGTVTHDLACQLALDANFWKALHKVGVLPNEFWIVQWRASTDDKLDETHIKSPDWYAHKFYDLLLTGQPTDTFWASLLTPSNSTRV